jgi:AraC family transcriptional regulator
MDPDRIEVQHVFGARDPVIKHLGRALWGELHADGLGGQVYAASLAQVLAIHLLRTACVRAPVLQPATGRLPRPALQRVLAYISDHLAQPITLADLAALVPMDPYRFLKAFRQTMRVTPHQYLLARRTERAQALLKDSTMPITDVAFQVGFRTPSHFTWHFRRQTGVTPTAYRRAVW